MPENFSKKCEKIEKSCLHSDLHNSSSSALSRYRKKVLGGRTGIMQLFQYELANLVCLNTGGGLGYLLRRWMYSSLFERCGQNVILGKGLVIRKPAQIAVGNKVSIDDFCQLDAGGVEHGNAIILGDGTLLSLGCILQAKTNPLVLGAHCDIGAYTILTSIGGIILGDSVLVAGNCYIGGGRYYLEDLDVPIAKQGIYSRGPVKIGEGSWIGAAVTILDGVSIGRGCVIGAGSLVTKDIPDYAIALGVPAEVVRYRTEQEKM